MKQRAVNISSSILLLIILSLSCVLEADESSAILKEIKDLMQGAEQLNLQAQKNLNIKSTKDACAVAHRAVLLVSELADNTNVKADDFLQETADELSKVVDQIISTTDYIAKTSTDSITSEAVQRIHSNALKSQEQLTEKRVLIMKRIYLQEQLDIINKE